jgi:hypothetical protein
VTHTYRVLFTDDRPQVRCRLYVCTTERQKYRGWLSCGDFWVQRGEQFAALVKAARGFEFIETCPQCDNDRGARGKLCACGYTFGTERPVGAP